jgi:hypothetical protein
MAAYVPYQVDYKVENKAKSLGFSKKKVVFKFGIANNQAIQEGMVGSGCRGSEHEVIFIWSLKSGKRQIIADNKEVHFSESGQNGWTGDRAFQHHFGIQSPGFGAVRCHLITLPTDASSPGLNHPFDLRIGGISYFEFSKIFQLGTPGMILRPAPNGGGVGPSYTSRHDEAYTPAAEREMIAKAKLESLRDVRQSMSQEEVHRNSVPTPVVREASLISFEEPPLPPRSIPQQMSSVTLDPAFSRTPSTSSYGFGALPEQQHVTAPYSNYQVPPPQPFAPPAAGTYSNYQLPPAPVPVPQYSTTVPTYGQQPPVYGQQPPAYEQQAYGQQTHASVYGFGQPAPYHQHVPPSMDPGIGFSQLPQPGVTNPGFVSPQSAVSYGSAPSFAQPPRQYGY